MKIDQLSHRGMPHNNRPINSAQAILARIRAKAALNGPASSFNAVVKIVAEGEDQADLIPETRDQKCERLYSLLSYPMTDCRNISAEMREIIDHIVAQTTDTPRFSLKSEEERFVLAQAEPLLLYYCTDTLSDKVFIQAIIHGCEDFRNILRLDTMSPEAAMAYHFSGPLYGYDWDNCEPLHRLATISGSLRKIDEWINSGAPTLDSFYSFLKDWKVKRWHRNRDQQPPSPAEDYKEFRTQMASHMLGIITKIEELNDNEAMEGFAEFIGNSWCACLAESTALSEDQEEIAMRFVLKYTDAPREHGGF